MYLPTWSFSKYFSLSGVWISSTTASANQNHSGWFSLPSHILFHPIHDFKTYRRSTVYERNNVGIFYWHVRSLTALSMVQILIVPSIHSSHPHDWRPPWVIHSFKGAVCPRCPQQRVACIPSWSDDGEIEIAITKWFSLPVSISIHRPSFQLFAFCVKLVGWGMERRR